MNCIDARPMKFANLMAKLADDRRAWMFLSNQGYGNHIFRFAENRGFPDSEKLCGFAPLRENLFREIVDGADDSITRILLENRRSFGFLVGVACKKMARKTNPHTWSALKESGELQERHVLMAMDLRMVCHFNKCPKHKFECRVPGCGRNRFVQILPWFRLKSRRLNEFTSQILFQRPT